MLLESTEHGAGCRLDYLHRPAPRSDVRGFRTRRLSAGRHEEHAHLTPIFVPMMSIRHVRKQRRRRVLSGSAGGGQEERIERGSHGRANTRALLSPKTASAVRGAGPAPGSALAAAHGRRLVRFEPLPSPRFSAVHGCWWAARRASRRAARRRSGISVSDLRSLGHLLGAVLPLGPR